MKSILAVVCGVLLLSSCDVEKSNPIIGQDDLNPPKKRDYTSAELGIGRNICKALKFKREKMTTITNMAEKFSFSGESRDCTTPFATFRNFDAVIETVGTAPRYISTLAFFQDVVTDDSALIQTLCDNLEVSDSVSNVMASGSSYYTVNLLMNNGYETVELKKQTRNSSGQYPHVSTEKIAVITLSSQADAKFMGIEKERVLETICPANSKNTNSFSYVKQTWKGTSTPY